MPRRGENIFKRKDGRWEARYVKEIALDGTKKYGSVYAKTYREVKEKQQARINRPFQKERKNTSTVDELTAEWLANVDSQLKISSLQRYQSIVAHISEKLGSLSLKYVSVEIISQFEDSLLNEKKLSLETVNQILIVLGMSFKFARERYRITSPEIKLLKTSKRAMRVLTVEEQQILVKRLLKQDDIFSFGILFALYTGVRVGELCALRWENISVTTINIDKTM